MEPRDIAQGQGLARLGTGVLMMAAPRLVAGGWIGRDARRAGTQVLTRVFGAREIALGAGQALAARSGAGVRPWLLAGVAVDAVDLAVTTRGRDRLPTLGVAGVAVLAGGSTALGAYLARQLD